MDTDTATLVARLGRIVGQDRVVVDPEECAYLSQDAFWDGAVAAIAIRPANSQALADSLAAASAAGFASVPRGGGMSYTRGYVPTRERSVIVDCRDLDRIVTINADDLYVTAEAGCTWLQLYTALKPLGLRTPYFGPMSGRFATVGGALSQNSMFYGSAQYGTVAESVLGIEVALADGRLLRTGAGAHPSGTPFFRHFGPDLTGLFLSDTGALGIKVEATLRLIRAPACTEFASFAFGDFPALVDAQAEIGRAGLAAECFGLDPYLNSQRTMTKDLATGLATLGSVVRAGSSIASGLRDAAGVAVAGARARVAEPQYSLHVTCDAAHAADAAWRRNEVERIAVAAGGRPIDPVVPRVVRANPFRHVGEFLVGHQGERWVPIHACLPASRVKAVQAATMAYLDTQADVLRRYAIKTSHLTGSSGTDIVFEPAFYYPDALKPFHLRNLEPADADRYRRQPAVPGASEAVARMLGDLARIFLAHGAVHQQLGKFYPYQDALQPAAREVLAGLKRVVDPLGLVNPGALGLGLAAPDDGQAGA